MKQISRILFSSFFVLFAGACAQQNKPAETSPNTSASETTSSASTTNQHGSAREHAELTPASGPATTRAADSSAGAETLAREKSATSPGTGATSEASNQAADAGSPSTDAPARTPDVVYVPTPQAVVDRMLKVAKVTKNDVVYDLGCGDGRIVVTAAKRYGARAYGFDVDPQRIAEARENVKKNGVGHLVTITQADIFTLDLSPASVVTLYLLPRLNVKLIPQLEKLKPGSRIVSHDFDMEGVTPVQQLDVNAEDRSHGVYLWTTPLKREGGVMRPQTGS